MPFRIRSTEEHPHPIWEQFTHVYPIAEIEGFLFKSTVEELQNATNNASKHIPITCLEAIEYDDCRDYKVFDFYSYNEWENMINAAKFFGTEMLMLTHDKSNKQSFMQLFEVNLTKTGSNKPYLNTKVIDFFDDESEFMLWWSSVKQLAQTKGTTEARGRQDRTVFDSVIERNKSAWGGNMDGLLLSKDKKQVKAIIELRQSRNFPIAQYDPAKFFKGTMNKGGDYNTWLPLIYLKEAYNLPIILITINADDHNSFGYAEVQGITKNDLLYVNSIAPTANVTTDFNVFKTWLDKILGEA